MSTITSRREPNYLVLCFLSIIIVLLSSLVLAPPHIYRAEEPTEQTEHSKSSGKNGQHANQKARKAAKEKYDQLKKEYDSLNQQPNKTKADKKTLEQLKRQLRHWKKKADFKGTNHSRNAKGN